MQLSRVEYLLSVGDPRIRFLAEKERRRRLREREAIAAEAEGLRTITTESVTGHKPLTFRGASLEAQTITEPAWIIAGPAETSKTTACLERLFREAMRTPGSRWVIVRKVRASMRLTVVETWRALLLHHGYDVRKPGCEIRELGGTDPSSYLFPNGAEVFIAGVGDVEAILGAGLDGVYVCQAEQLEAGDWDTLRTRTTGRAAKVEHPMLWGDCNPGAPNHWILKRRDEGHLRLLRSVHRDNPFLFADDGTPLPQWTLRTGPALDSLTGVKGKRLRDGLWVAAEGVVYEEWDPDVHECEAFPLPLARFRDGGWRLIISIDFGFVHPCTAQFWAIDPDGAIFLAAEVYRTGMLVETLASEIRRILTGVSHDPRHGLVWNRRGHDREEWERLSRKDARPEERQRLDAIVRRGLRAEAVVCDHDREDRATLASHGVPNVAAQKAIETGIDAVRARLKVDARGKARLVLFRDSLLERDDALAKSSRPTCLREELALYRYPVAVDGKPSRKEGPVKEHDDGCDAARYAVMHLRGSDGTGLPGVGLAAGDQRFSWG